ncbi:MAG: SpoIIE family protein phosphatase [Bacteroidales bacterium]|nr:SpoIIE family protein phosphatase [Bacteroidales bacterium]
MKKIFFFLIILPFALSGQTIKNRGIPAIKKYTIEDYNVESSQNWDITQDNRGIMYFANTEGLLEFDGENWQLIEIPNKSNVRSLTTGNNGKIYIGSVCEFGYLKPDSLGQMQYVSLVERFHEQHHTFKDVWDIKPTKHGIIFRTSLKLYIIKDNKIKVIESKTGFHRAFSIHNEYYIRDKGKGIMKLENDSLKLIPDGELFQNQSIYLMLPFSNDKTSADYKKILLCTKTKGFFIFDGKKITPWEIPVNDFILKNEIYCGALLNNEYFALGTIQEGIIIIDKTGKPIQHYNINIGLQDNVTLDIFIDSHKNMWIAHDNGISFVETNSPFSYYNKYSDLPKKIYTSTIYNNNIYAGTAQCIYYKNWGLYENPLENSKKFRILKNSKGQVWNFMHYHEQLLCAHNPGLLSIYDNIAKTIALKHKNAWTIYESEKNPQYLFVGTNKIDLLEFKKNKWEWKHNIKGFNEEVRSLTGDKNGNLWVGHDQKGIYKLILNDKLDSITNIYLYNSQNGLPSDFLNSVKKLGNKILFKTEKGLYEYNSQTDSIEPYKKFNNKLIYGIDFNIFSEDAHGNIWFQDNKELGLMKLQDDSTYQLENIPYYKFKAQLIHHVTPYNDSTVFFETNKQLVHYDPSIIINYNIPYPTIIRKVEEIINDSLIFGGTYTDSDGYVILEQPETQILEFPFERNALRFTYSSPYFEDIDKIQYKFILEGFNKDWSNWTNENKKEYSNIPPGKYIFRVKAKNIYQIESIESSYQFTITPPWYRTILAYIFYFLLVVLFIWGIVKFNIKRLKAANLHLENIVSKRTSEIQQQKEEILAQAEELEVTNKELEKLSIVASETDNAVLILDADGKIEWINEGFTRIIGYTLDEIWAIKGHDFIKTSSNPNIKKEFNKCKEQKTSVIYSTKNYTKDNREIWTQTTLTPILNKDNNIIKFIAIDTDITKIKLAEEEIKKQKNEIEGHRDEIAKINIEVRDSILYASRIQSALLTPQELMNKYLLDYFIINEPRDIVSGDFYWFSEIKNKIVIAVADCTGHGVPGAFMSMLGVTLLNKIVNEKGIIKPNEILDKLRANIIASLHQTGEMGEANDGMDIALITIDKINNSLEYAGANNSAYLFQNNELKEICANKMPIGIYSEIETPFSCQKMSIQKEDIIYLFTDGYADQFGGIRGRKFLYKNFKELLKELHQLQMNEQKTKLLDIFNQWKGNNDRVDDILIMGIKI